MPTVGSLKVLIEGDMRPYLVTVRQADEATQGLTRRMGRDIPDALRRANKAVDESTKGLAAMATQAMQAYRSVVALAGAWGASKVVKSLNDFAKAAHEAEAGGIIFGKMLERVGESARRVEPELEALANELRIAPEIIRSNAAELLRAGYNWEQIATIYRGAGASALLAGKSTAEGVEIATTALVTGLSTYLNQIGIAQNLSTAYTEYARSLGKTTEQLTDQERAAAATLMIQRATAQEVQDMPVLLEGYGGAVSDLTRLWYDFRVALGSLVLPVATSVLRALSAMLKPINNIVTWLRQMRSASKEAADAIADVTSGSLEHARTMRQQAQEISSLLDRYEQLASATNRSAEEQAEIESIVNRIADLQPGLVAGYQDLETAVRNNIEPLRQYAEALKNASDIELELAARRAELAMPSLRQERERVIAERDALIEANREQFLQAQRLQTLAAEAVRLAEIISTSPLGAREGEQAIRDLQALLTEAFPDGFFPGAPLLPFVQRLRDDAAEAMAAFSGMADKIEELDARAKELERSISEAETAIEAYKQAQAGIEPFPVIGATPAVTPPTRGLSPLERIYRDRGMKAWTARLNAQAEAYFKSIENIGLGTEQKLKGLEAIALERSWRAYGERYKAAAEYYASLPELRLRQLEEERRAEEQAAEARRRAEQELADDLAQLTLSETDYFAYQLHRQIEEFRAAGVDEAEIAKWTAAQWEAYWAQAEAETVAKTEKAIAERQRLEEQAARERARLEQDLANDIARLMLSETDYFAYQLHQRVEALRAAGVEEANIAKWVAAQWDAYWEQAERAAVEATQRDAEERRRAEEQLARERQRALSQIEEDLARYRMTETEFFGWQLERQAQTFRAAGVDETIISTWKAAQWDQYFAARADEAARKLDGLGRGVSELDRLIAALRGAGETDLAGALAELRRQAESEDLFVSRIAQERIDEATRMFWEALAETGDVALAAAEALDALRDVTEEITAWEQMRAGIQEAILGQLGVTGQLITGLTTGNWQQAGAAGVQMLLEESEALADAFEALIEGVAALLAPLDMLFELLGPRASATLVGSGAGLLVGGPIGAAVGAVVGWLGGAAQEQESAAELLQEASEALREATEEWREFVRTAPLHELFSELEGIERRRQAEQEWLDRLRERLPFGLGQLLPEATGVEVPQEILDERRRIEQQIKDIEKWGVWPWERSRYESLKDALREIDKQIREFQESAAEELEERIREALGIGWRELASGVRSAFDEATLGDFTESVERELKMRVRNALITAFLESAAMAPLFESLSDSIMEAVRDGVLSAGELDAIEDIISQITDNSVAFFEVLDELGLSMEDLADTTREVNESLRNVPSGFKYVLSRFSVAEPVPLADGGVVTRPMLALVGERGPEAVVPLRHADRFGATAVVVHVQVQGPVYGMDDFDRRVQEAVNKATRRANLASTGLARR